MAADCRKGRNIGRNMIMKIWDISMSIRPEMTVYKNGMRTDPCSLLPVTIPVFRLRNQGNAKPAYRNPC